MCLFCNRGSGASAAFQQHSPPDPWKWSLFGRPDGAIHPREAQTWSSRTSYRRCTAECREPFGWAGKLRALANVSNQSQQGLLHWHHPAVSIKLVWVSFTYFRPTPLAVPDEQADAAGETPTQQQARMSASSATRELDELMASLSDFKVQSNVSSFQGYRRTCGWYY